MNIEIENIFDFINVFKKYNIDLIAYGGTSITLLRDSEFPPNCANFILNCNNDLVKLFPNCKGSLKNNCYINQNLVNDLNNIMWFFKDDRYKYDSPRNFNSNYTFDLLKFKFKDCNYYIDIWPFLCINDLYYYGLRCNIILGKQFIEQCIDIKIINKYNILIPYKNDILLEIWYGDWKTKSNKHGECWNIYYDNNNQLIRHNWTEKRSNPNFRINIPKEYINYNIYMDYNEFLFNLTKMPVLNQDPLRYILKNNLLNDSDLLLEFGCWKGQTIDMISNYTTNNIYGFDTFEGIDYIWNEVDMKKFKLDDIPTEVQQLDFNKQYKQTNIIKPFNKNVKFIKGLFDDTLPNFMQENNKKISFIHIDCDIYESTKTIFKYCGKNISNNCIIVFDDLLNNKNFENHEIKAFYEWVNENNIKYEWIGSNTKVCTVEEINFIDNLTINKNALNFENFPRFNDDRNNILFNDKLFLFNLNCQAVVKILYNPFLDV